MLGAGAGGSGRGAAPVGPMVRPLLRTRLIGVLGTFGDDEIVGEAKRRFARFVSDPTSLATALRETVTGLAPRSADRAISDPLLPIPPRTTNPDAPVPHSIPASTS